VAVTLTPRELALLDALMERPGDVVAKRDLLARVWGDDVDGDANVVEVYVGYLRRKIDVPFGRHSLQTVRGVGYRVVDDG
jgi:two-component system OmpR family response regulator